MDEQMLEQEKLTEEEEQSAPAPTLEVLTRILITQAVCIAVILIGLLAVRFISPKTYQTIRVWYTEYFLTETTVDEVLGAGDAADTSSDPEPPSPSESDASGTANEDDGVPDEGAEQTEDGTQPEEDHAD